MRRAPALSAVFLLALAATASCIDPPPQGGPRALFERTFFKLPRARLAASLPPGCSSLAGPGCLYGEGEGDDGDDAGLDATTTAVAGAGAAASRFQVLLLPPSDAAAVLAGAHPDLSRARLVYEGDALAGGDPASVAAAVAGAVGAAQGGGAQGGGGGEALRAHLTTVLAGAQQQAAAAGGGGIRGGTGSTPLPALDVVEGTLADATAARARAMEPPIPAPALAGEADAGLAALDDADPASGHAPEDDDLHDSPPRNGTMGGHGEDGYADDDDYYYDDEYDEYEDDPLAELGL
jgi:hypothetical protein